MTKGKHSKDHNKENDIILEKIQAKIHNYKVILLNDDYTSINFVTFVIGKVFNKSEEEAHNLTMEIHNQESAVCGIYNYDIAHTKAREVRILANLNEYPLQCQVVKE